LEVLQNPVIEIILAAVIFLSILAEIKTAGFSGGGLVAAVFGMLLIGSRWTGEISSVYELLLFFGGLALISLDLLFLATGAAAAAGLVAVAASLYFVFGAGLSAMYILAAGAVAAVIGMCFLAKRLSENRLWKKISLSTSLTTQKGFVSAAEDLSKWEGKEGRAQSVLRPAGKVEIEGKVLDAVTGGAFLEAGTPVYVVKAESNRVVVEEIRNAEFGIRN